MGWGICKFGSGPWVTCEVGGRLWQQADWRWQVSSRRARAEVVALNANRGLHHLSPCVTLADQHTGNAAATGSAPCGFTEQAAPPAGDNAVARAPAAARRNGDGAHERHRRRYHTINLDGETFAQVRDIAARTNLPLIDVVRRGIASLTPRGDIPVPKSVRKRGGVA